MLGGDTGDDGQAEPRTAAGARPVAAASAVAWVAALPLTTLVLAVSALWSTSVLASLLAVVCANGAVSVGRFVAVRALLFRQHLDSLSQPTPRPPG